MKKLLVLLPAIILLAGCAASRMAVYPYSVNASADKGITLVNGTASSYVDAAVNGTMVVSRMKPGDIQRIAVNYSEGEVVVVARALTPDGKYRGVAYKTVTLVIAASDSANNEKTVVFKDADFK